MQRRSFGERESCFSRGEAPFSLCLSPSFAVVIGVALFRMISIFLALTLCLPILTTVYSQIDPSTISFTLRTQWCQGQQNTCGTLCSGAVNLNDCNPTTLTYDCTCASNNSTPDLGAYTETIPYFLCEETFVTCINSSAGDPSAELACNSAEKANCGTLDPNTFVASAATSTIAQTSTDSTLPVSSSISTDTSSVGTTSTATSMASTSLAVTRSIETSNSATDISSRLQEIVYATTLADGVVSTVTSLTSVGASRFRSTYSTSPASNPTSSMSSTPQSSSGLSTGAKAGIGIGAVAIVITLALGGYCLGRRHSKSVGSTEAGAGLGIPELSMHTHLEVPELAGEKRSGIREKVSELDGGGRGGGNNRYLGDLGAGEMIEEMEG